MKRKFMFTIIIAVIAAAISGCLPGGEKPAATEQAAPAEKSFNIRVVEAVRTEISSHLTLSGDVEASTSVEVYPNASGKLTALLVEPGSWVKKGQIIAGVDPAKPGMRYAESPIESPISGTVTAVKADPGSTVGPQMALFTIGDINRLIITAQVPERFIYMIEKGQTALITTTAAPGMKYKAEVASVSPVVNPVSRTLQIELGITEESPVKAGMFVGIELITSTSADALVLPEKAVLSRDTDFVYRVQGDRVEKVNVSTGLRNGGMVEIISGLSENDRIVLDGATLLSDGSRVNILNNEESR